MIIRSFFPIQYRGTQAPNLSFTTDFAPYDTNWLSPVPSGGVLRMKFSVTSRMGVGGGRISGPSGLRVLLTALLLTIGKQIAKPDFRRADIWPPVESSGWIFRDVTNGSGRITLPIGRNREETANGERDVPATSRKIHSEAGYPPSGNRVLPPGLCRGMEAMAWLNGEKHYIHELSKWLSCFNKTRMSLLGIGHIM